MSDSAFLSEEPVCMDPLQKTRQLTQLATHSQKVPQPDSPDLRSSDAFVPTIKEEVEDPDYGSVPTSPKPAQVPQSTAEGHSSRLFTKLPYNQMPPNMAHPYPTHGFMPLGYYLVNGRPMLITAPIPMQGQSYGGCPQRDSRPPPKMSRHHFPYSLPVNVRANQVQKQSKDHLGNEEAQSPSEMSSDTDSAPFAKKNESVPVQQKTGPVPPQPMIPQPILFYPPPINSSRRRRAPPSKEIKAKKMKEQDEAFIDTFKAIKVPSQGDNRREHDVFLYKFKEGDETLCYVFNWKSTTQYGQSFVCCNCKQITVGTLHNITIKKGFFQSDPTLRHKQKTPETKKACKPKKFAEEMAIRMRFGITPKIKKGEYGNLGWTEIYERMLDDVSTNENLTDEEKKEVIRILSTTEHVQASYRAIRGAQNKPFQREKVEKRRASPMLMMCAPVMMTHPQTVKQPIPVIKLEDD